MANEKLIEYLEHEIYIIKKALEGYPDAAGNDYIEGKLIAYRDVLRKVTEGIL